MSDTVLIIDDDARLAEMVRAYLEQRGLRVEIRHDAASGLRAVAEAPPSAVLLDVMLPDMDGFEVLGRLRASSRVPVLMLTARGDADDRIVGLEMGADDYIPKPFNPRELLARLRAVLRRARPEVAEDVLRFGRLEIDRGARRARLDGAPCALTSHQFKLLLALAEGAGRVLTRDQLMQAARGEDLEAFDRSIDVHISRIRAAIEADPKKPTRILTVRGVGYLFTRKQA